MTKSNQIGQLQALAQIILDSKLADLRKAASARAETLGHLADLAAPDVFIDDAQGVAEAKANLAYQQWADARRSELNLTLARQTAVWMDMRDIARQSFGKSDVLASLAELEREKRRKGLR